MITEEDARRIAQEQIDKINPSLEINFIYAVNAENPDDALYFVGVRDPITNKQYYPGELFPSIRMSDGGPVDFVLIPPGQV